MTEQIDNPNEAILRNALNVAPQPIAIIDDPVESREKLAELIIGAKDLPNCRDCKGVVVYYRTVEHLFPSQHLSPSFFNLSIPEYAEITRWANEHGWGANYLDHTEGMSLRPFFFSFQNK